MKTKITKSGRVIIDLDGWNEYHRAFIQGAWTGKVSLPAEYTSKDEGELRDIALECLIAGPEKSKNIRLYKAKIIRKLDTVK